MTVFRSSAMARQIGAVGTRGSRAASYVLILLSLLAPAVARHLAIAEREVARAKLGKAEAGGAEDLFAMRDPLRTFELDPEQELARRVERPRLAAGEILLLINAPDRGRRRLRPTAARAGANLVGACFVMREARERVFGACRANGIAFLETATPASITSKLDEGVRVIAGHSEEAARLGRAHQNRQMPV